MLYSIMPEGTCGAMTTFTLKIWLSVSETDFHSVVGKLLACGLSSFCLYSCCKPVRLLADYIGLLGI